MLEVLAHRVAADPPDHEPRHEPEHDAGRPARSRTRPAGAPRSPRGASARRAGASPRSRRARPATRAMRACRDPAARAGEPQEDPGAREDPRAKMITKTCTGTGPRGGHRDARYGIAASTHPTVRSRRSSARLCSRAEASGFLVGPAVFNTDVGAQAPRRVRFPSASAWRDRGVAVESRRLHILSSISPRPREVPAWRPAGRLVLGAGIASPTPRGLLCPAAVLSVADVLAPLGVAAVIAPPHAAQHESISTSVVKLCAVSLMPSAMVR